MGVPLVTQAGARWSGRMSQDILSGLGLQEWVARDTEEYIALAVQMAGRLSELAPLRAQLRRRVEQSSFCDGENFTRRLENAYRAMWRSGR
jgi:predicted O-linked N-acetylglucosamine transferase (SPINDLY family)